MRSQIVLLAVLLASVCTAIRAADDFVAPLVDKAKTGETPQIRAQAMDEIGKLGAKGLGSQVNAAVTGLGEIAHVPTTSSTVPAEAKEFLRLHAINALGLIGPGARAALPQIATVVGNDLTLDAAVNTAVSLIAADDPTKQTTSTQPAQGPSAATIKGYVQDLTNKDDASIRLAAVKSLDGVGQLALPYFNMLADLMATDPDVDVRRVAAETAKDLIAHLPEKTPAQTTDIYTDIYLKNLAVMSQLKLPAGQDRDVQERLFAVAAFADLAYKSPPNPYALGQITILASDKDSTQVAALAKVNPNAKPADQKGAPAAEGE